MTVLVGYRVPGQGAVLMSDGRATDDNGNVCSDNTLKLAMFPEVTVAVCGCLGAGQKVLEPGIETSKDLRMRVRDLNYDNDALGIIVHDRRKDRLYILQPDGAEVEYPNVVAQGSGADFALGAVLSMRKAHTLSEAVRKAHRAVRVACKMQVHCGGKVQWFRSLLVK
jgi:membrane-bound inhibitor of C-type lysozyme